MSNFDLKIPRSEQRKFEKELKKYQKKNDKEFTHRVQQAALATQKMAQRKAPVDQGDLKEKITSHTDIAKTHKQAQVISNADYSAAVENGTKPHTIRVRNKKVLAAHKGGGWNFFGKEVDHPGTRAQPFLYPAWHKAQKDLLKGLRRVFK